MPEQPATERAGQGRPGAQGPGAPGVQGQGMPGMGRAGGVGSGGPFSGLFSVSAKPKDTGKTLRRASTLLSPHKAALFAVFLLVASSSVLSLAATRMIGTAIDDFILPGDLSGLARYAAGLAGVYSLAALASWSQMFIMAGVSHRVVTRLRGQLFEHIHGLPVSYFDTHARGETMSRLANDVETVSQTLSTSTTLVLSSVITIAGSLTGMLLISPVLTLVSLLSAPVAALLARRVAQSARQMFSARQQSLGKLNGLIEESIVGHKVLKLYGQEENYAGKFAATNAALRDAGTKAEMLSGMVRPLMTMVSSSSFALLATLGGTFVLRGVLAIGQVASFMQFSRQFAGPVNEIANQFNSLQAAVAGLERVYELLDEQPEPADAPDALALKEVTGDVQFREVGFGYAKGQRVLDGVSLHAPSGGTVAIVGPTGAGKTTMMNLLMRFYDVDEGSILLDGHDLRSLVRADLRRSLAIVLQDTYLFAGTVRDNIRYGRLEASDDDIRAAAAITGADVFIERLPDGYASVLTEEGGNLSQGQRQLLSITRAVLANPRVLILDEATSSVDTRTEMNLQQAMLTLMRGRTSFIIAHRLSTIRGADEILFISEGKIIERGTHEELLAAGGRYAKLYFSQFHREEVVRKAI